MPRNREAPQINSKPANPVKEKREKKEEELKYMVISSFPKVSLGKSHKKLKIIALNVNGLRASLTKGLDKFIV